MTSEMEKDRRSRDRYQCQKSYSRNLANKLKEAGIIKKASN